MIALKNLQNRVYEGKKCVQFEYYIPNDKGYVKARFSKKIVDDYAVWCMQIILDRTRDKDSDVYNFMYKMPKEDLPLELIAATGLRYFQLYLKEEIQMKSNLDFTIGSIVEGM